MKELLIKLLNWLGSVDTGIPDYARSQYPKQNPAQYPNKQPIQYPRSKP